MMHGRHKVAALFTALLLIGSPAFAQNGAAEKIRAEQVLPDGTLLYIALEDITASINKLKAGALGKIHNEADVKPLTSKIVDRILKGIGQFEKKTKIRLDDFRKAFKGQVSLAIVGMVDNPFDGEMLPQIVLVAEDRNAKDAIDRLIRDVSDRVQTLAPQLESMTYEFEGTPVSALGVGELKICHAQTHGLFIGALTESAMDLVLTNLGKSKGKTLSEHPAFIASRKKAAGSGALAYVNLEKFLKALGDYQKIDFEGGRMLQITGLDRAKGAAIGIGAIGGGVKDVVTINATERTGVIRLLASTPAQVPARKFVPEGAAALVAARIEPGRIYQEVLDFIEKAEGPARVDMIKQGVEAAKVNMGIDLKAQLIDGLTGEILLYVDSPAEGGLIPDGVAMVQLTEGSRFMDLFNMARPMAFRNATFDSFDYHGTRIHFGRLRDKDAPIIPTYAVRDGHFIFATSTQSMKRLVLRMNAIAAGDTVRNITDKADFRQVTSNVSKKGSMLIYADAKLLFNRIYGTAVHFMMNKRPVRRLGLEPNELPTPETVSKHLFGFAMTLSSDNAGNLTLEGFSPAGSLSMVPLTAIIVESLKGGGGNRGPETAATIRRVEPARDNPQPVEQPEEAPDGAEAIF